MMGHPNIIWSMGLSVVCGTAGLSSANKAIAALSNLPFCARMCVCWIFNEFPVEWHTDRLGPICTVYIPGTFPALMQLTRGTHLQPTISTALWRCCCCDRFIFFRLCEVIHLKLQMYRPFKGVWQLWTITVPCGPLVFNVTLWRLNAASYDLKTATS